MDETEYQNQNTNEEPVPLPAPQTTIEARQARQKEALIEQMRKTPIVQIACEKMGVSRASYYRWRSSNKQFAQAADAALAEGTGLMNDMAESQLLSAVRDKNFSAIAFWLKHHHPSYGTRVEVTAKLEHLNQQLTPEQQQVVNEALRLAALAASSGERKE